MPTLRFAFLVLYLSYVLLSGAFTKQGSGWDPDGLTSPPPPPPHEQGGGLDPLG